MQSCRWREGWCVPFHSEARVPDIKGPHLGSPPVVLCFVVGNISSLTLTSEAQRDRDRGMTKFCFEWR